MNTQNLSRRNFLKTGALAAAATQLPIPALLAAENYGAKRIPVNLQMYTIGQESGRRGLANTFAALSQMGYKGVEFAGYPGGDLKEVRMLLDDNGMKCVGNHGQPLGANLDQQIEQAKILGNPRICASTIGGLTTVDAINRSADQMSEVAAKLKPLGLFTGFHCHPGEFRTVEETGKTVYDLFFSRASKDVIMQIDLGHMGTGGGNHVDYMTRFPGQAKTVHVKPSNGATLIGEGTDKNNWPVIFNACETVGGTEVYVVEYDGGTWEKTTRTIQRLKEWGKV